MPQDKRKRALPRRYTSVVELQAARFMGVVVAILGLGTAATQVSIAWGDWRLAARVVEVEIDDGQVLRGTAALQHMKRSAAIHALAASVLLAGVPIGVVIVVRSSRRLARLKRGCCVRCGYNLTGNVTGRCPECGEPTAERSSSGSD